LDRYKETFETWNKIALLYQDKFMDMDLYNETYNFICDSIKKPKAKILEIGCGPGNITRYLLSQRPDYNIHGIDVAPRMIELATTNNPTASFSVMDCRNISEISEKFDGIICGFCLPYLSNFETKKLIGDSKDLLNDEGFLYLSFVEGDPAKSGFQVASSGDRSYFNYHDLEIIKAQLSENLFDNLKIFKVSFKRSATETEMHTIVTGKRKLEDQS
jgi:2-polyprenyl-3-methyl-5-hydroxy-6-metoxy-1,4-benzoquinol methylase